MEGDFEGDTFDLPSDAENSDEEEGEDEDQRLDQEMGDVGEEGQVSKYSALRQQAFAPHQGLATVMLARSS